MPHASAVSSSPDDSTRPRRRSGPSVLGLPIVALCSSLALISCSADSPTEEIEEAPILDFSAIEGTWVGTGLENVGVTFWIEARLSASAEQGKTVGEVQYGPEDSEHGDGTEALCEGQWRAAAVDPPRYEVNEVIAPCPNGTVYLEYDLDEETLGYYYVPDNGNMDIEATAVLVRQ